MRLNLQALTVHRGADVKGKHSPPKYASTLPSGGSLSHCIPFWLQSYLGKATKRLLLAVRAERKGTPLTGYKAEVDSHAVNQKFSPNSSEHSCFLDCERNQTREILHTKTLSGMETIENISLLLFLKVQLK